MEKQEETETEETESNFEYPVCYNFFLVFLVHFLFISTMVKDHIYFEEKSNDCQNLDQNSKSDNLKQWKIVKESTARI